MNLEHARKGLLRNFAGIILAFLLWGGLSGDTFAQTIRTWNGSTSANWNTALNWTLNDIPNTSAEEALFTSAGPHLVNLNANLTIGFYVINDATSYTFSSGSGNKLTLKDASTSTSALVNVINGSHTFSAGLAMTDAQGVRFTIDGTSSLAISGIVSGTVPLIKDGTGTLTLSGANTFTKAVQLNAGVLNVQNSLGLGTTAGGVTVASGAALELQNGIAVGAEALSLSGTGISSGGALRNVNSVNSWSGAVTLAADSRINSDSGTLTLSGLISGTKNLIVGGAANVTLNGVVGISTGTVTKDGAGTLTFGGTGADTYTGITTVNEGTLLLGKTAVTAIAGNIVIGDGSGGAGADILKLNAAAQIADTAAVTINSSGRFDLNNNAETVGSIASSSSVSQIVLGSGTLTTGNGSPSTFAGVISGTGNIAKQGSGTLTLSGASTYLGATTVNQGVLNLQNANAAGDVAGGVTVASGAALELQGGIAVGAEALRVSGTGITSGGVQGGALRNISGNNSWAGATTLLGATRINSDSGSLTLSGAISGAGQNLTFGGAGDTTVSGAITTGAGTVTKDGSGTLTVSGANTYTGATTISGGSLALGANNAISSDVTVNGGTLQLNGTYSTLVGNLSFNGGTLDFGPVGTANSFMFNNGGSQSGQLTIAHWEDGIDRLAVKSTSTLLQSFLDNIFFADYGAGASISGSNQTIPGYGSVWTYLVPNTVFDTWNGNGANNSWSTGLNWSDTTAPTSGVLSKVAFGGSTRLAPDLNSDYLLHTLRFNSDAGSFTLGSTSAKTLTFAGALPSILQQSASSQAITVGITLNTGLTVNGTGAGDLTLSGVIGGVGGITTTTIGKLILTGNNSYAGATVIQGGIVNIQNANALGSTAAGTTVNVGGALEVQGGISVGAEALTLNGTGVSGNGSVRNLSGNNSFAGGVTLGSSSSIQSDSGTLTMSGAIGGAGQNLSISGAGDVTLSGVLGTGTGTLTKVGSGVLTLSGASANTFTGNTLINSGTILLNKSSGNAIVGPVTVGDGTGLAGSDILKLGANNQISDAAAVTISASGQFDLNGQTERVGSISATSPNAQISLGAGTLTSGDTSSTLFAGTISGSGGLTKEGSGSLTLSGPNSFTGAVAINAGSVNIQNVTALGTTAGGVSVGSNAALELQGGIAVGAEALTLSGSGISSGGALRNISSDNSWAGNVVLANPTRINSDSGTLTISGGVSGAGQNLTVGGSGNVTFTGAIATTTGGLAIDGAGTVTLTGANTYSGATTIASGAALNVQNAAALGNTSSGTTVSSGGALQIQGDTLLNAETITINGSGIASDGAIRSISGANKLAGTISLNSASTIAVDTGTLTLNGSINNGGSTLTTAGGGNTIIAGGLSGSGGLVVNNGVTTLSGNTTFTGDITVNDGATLLLGASNRIVDSVNMSLSGGTFDTGGFSETLGTLTLSLGSEIDLGAGSGQALHFANSSGASWLGTEALVIENWTPSSQQIFFGSAVGGLTPTQLGQIVFSTPVGYFGAQILPTGEIRPVPEAKTVAGVCLISVFILFRERKTLRRLASRVFQQTIS